MELLIGFVVAIVVTMVLIPPLIKIAPRFQFVDLPQQRKVHAVPIPRVGGIAMAAGLLLSFAVWGHLASSTIALIAGVIVLVAFGMWDDRVTLSATPKFIGQAAAVLIVMIWGGVSIDSLILVSRHTLPAWISAPLTFMFLVGATNAINLADGLDGLAGGTTLMCLLGLALLSFTVGNAIVGGVALLTVGVVLGFLRYNTYPARVFMGDTGSQLLGFTAAVLSVQLTQDQTAPLSSALPLLLLGVPITDTLTVMTGRMLAGHSPFKADRNHLHHRLLSLGFDHHEAVMVIYLAQAMFFVTAWYARYESDLLIVAIFSAYAAAIVIPLRWAKNRQWRWRDGVRGEHVATSALKRKVEWLAAPERLPRWAFIAIVLSAVLYATVAMYVSALPAHDAGIVSFACAGVLALNCFLRWRQKEIGWIDKAALFIGAALLVFRTDFTGEKPGDLRLLLWLAVIVIALAVAVRLRLSRDRRFAVTPLDILVLIVAVVIPNLPGSIASPQALGAAVAKLIVLFYGIETVTVATGSRWKLLSLAALLTLIVYGLRAW